MRWAKGYIKDDFKVYINNFDNIGEPTEEERYILGKTTHYKIFVMIKGEAVLRCNEQVFNVMPKQMVFCDIDTLFSYNFFKAQEISYLEIMIYPNVINEKSEDMFFLRSLQDMPDESRIISLNDTKFTFINECVNSIIQCIGKDLGRPHILPRVRAIISQLDIYYDENFNTEKNTTDSLSVRIIHYINRHYRENITYDLICEKFFVSKPTVVKIMKVMTGKTMHKYIEEMRMKYARDMLNNRHSVSNAAERCGYNDYSTFLKAYKRFYNTSPSKNKKKNTDYFPLSK